MVSKHDFKQVLSMVLLSILIEAVKSDHVKKLIIFRA